MRVTCEVAPHHFTLTDEACASFDPAFKVHPPLRSASDVAAVRAGLEKEGGLSRVAAGLRREKSIDFIMSRVTLLKE